MKKTLSAILALTMSLSLMSFAAGAAEITPEDVGMTVIYGEWVYDPENCIGKSNAAGQASAAMTAEEAGITVIHGTWVYDPEHCLAAETGNRAVSVPTAYAPNSYFETWHQWTAVNYTYTSYLFNRPYTYGMDAYVPDTSKTFCVEFYSPNGSYIGTVNSSVTALGQTVLAYFNANVPSMPSSATPAARPSPLLIRPITRSGLWSSADAGNGPAVPPPPVRSSSPRR